MMRSTRRSGTGAPLAGALLLLSACASSAVPDTEQMLTAAGFQIRPADTPEKQAQLATLPPHRLLTERNDASGGPQLGYIYADPEGCHCAFVGDARAYQAFQQLAMQKRIADEHLRAAQMEQNAAMDWAWGPGFWGPEPPIIIHEHDHGRR
jgi:hypothetical protein